MPASAVTWQNTTLSLGLVDRWVRVFINGKRVFPLDPKVPWRQMHPAKPLFIPLTIEQFRIGENTLWVDTRRKYGGGLSNGIPAIGEQNELMARALPLQQKFLAMQSADLIIRIVLLGGAIVFWFFERQQRKLVGLLVITQIVIFTSAVCFYYPIVDDASLPQLPLQIGGYAALLFFSCGVLFLYRFYRHPIRWWEWAALVGIPATGSSPLAVIYFPEAESIPDLLFHVTTISSFVATISTVWIIVRRVLNKDYWAGVWLLVLLVSLPVILTMWFRGSESLDPLYTFFWAVYLGTWAWGILLLGCGIALIITKAKQASHYAHTTLRASEYERQRISRDLHDGVTQQIYAARIQASHAENSEAPQQKKILKELQGNLDKVSQEIRQVCHDLHRNALLGGLAAALQRDGQTLARLLDTKVVVVADEVILSEEVSSHLFQIFQEALSNAVRHGGAKRIDVLLFQSENSISLKLLDNGKGFRLPEISQDGLGLRSMKARAREIGAKIFVESNPGEGTDITIDLPLSKANLSPVKTASPQGPSFIPNYAD